MSDTERGRKHRRDFSAAAFAAWMKKMGVNQREASEMLGCSKNTVHTMLREGAPYYIGLACAALLAGLEIPYLDDTDVSE